MKLKTPKTAGALATLLMLIATAPAVLAEDEPGWQDVAEFSYVMTDGNSESSTLGFKNRFSRNWGKSSFTLGAGGVRAESATITRFGLVDGLGGFTEEENKVTETTAENYYLRGRYDRKISDRFLWYAGAGWDRNEFAGVENRYIGEFGVGNVWIDTDDVKFRTDYGLTYTQQDDVVEDPTRDDSFLGVRFSWGYQNKLTGNTTYENVLVLDGNADETSDYRADMVNSIAVAMNSRLALKLSLQALYDNQPSLATVQLFNTFPGDPVVPATFVEIPLDDLDTIFTASLVVNFGG